MVQITTIKESDFETHFSSLTEEDLLQLPYHSVLTKKYQVEYQSSIPFENHSFVVTVDNKPLMGMLMTSHTSDGTIQFSNFGRPCTLLVSKHLDNKQRKGCEKAFKKHLNELVFNNDKTSLLLHDYLLEGKLNVLTDMALSSGYNTSNDYYRVIDLQQDLSLIRGEVRDSYKSLINWGMKNLELQVKSSSSIVQRDIDEFRRLHIEEAGRETRSLQTWLTQLEQIANEEAFLVSGYLDGKLVTAALFLHSSNYCYYGVSASKRSLFDKPLGHSVIWKAIEHAKNLGCRYFELGEIVYSPTSAESEDTKLLNISKFKRGFGGDIRMRLRLSKGV